jgi:hypothetical protein
MRENKNDTSRKNDQSPGKSGQLELFADLHHEIDTQSHAARVVDSKNISVNAPHTRQRLYWVADPNGRVGDPQHNGHPPCPEHRSDGEAVHQCPPGQDGPCQFEGAGAPPFVPGWADPEWLYCGDGKYRPIKPGSIKMVTRISGGMVCCCNLSSQTNEPEKESEVIYGDASETDTTKILPALQFKAGTEADKWATGGLDGFQEKKILQSGMHGARSGQGSSDERESQSFKSNQKHQAVMRGVWKSTHTSCSSCGRESYKQLAIEFDDIVCKMPQGSTFAKFLGTDGSEYMQALRQASNEDRALLDSQYTAKEVWESLDDKEKDRVRVHFNNGNWIFEEGIKPLVDGVSGVLVRGGDNSLEADADNTQEARVMRLKGYGNAICVPVAVQFISAFMSI